jgi:hypothetical protein
VHNGRSRHAPRHGADQKGGGVVRVHEVDSALSEQQGEAQGQRGIDSCVTAKGVDRDANGSKVRRHAKGRGAGEGHDEDAVAVGPLRSSEVEGELRGGADVEMAEDVGDHELGPRAVTGRQGASDHVKPWFGRRSHALVLVSEAARRKRTGPSSGEKLVNRLGPGTGDGQVVCLPPGASPR